MSVSACFQMIDINQQRLCRHHYNNLHLCEYINDNGDQCINVIDNPFDEIPRMEEEDNEINGQIAEIIILGMKFSPRFCSQHICHVKGCQLSVINDRTDWCHRHATPCQYGQGGTHRCHLYYHNQIQPNNIYCDQHQCHWNTSIYDDDRCLSPIVIQRESSDYCLIHYQQYMFRKYEYSTHH